MTRSYLGIAEISVVAASLLACLPLAGGEAGVMLKRDVLGAGRLIDSRGDEFARSLVHDDKFLREVGLGLIMWETFSLTGG